MTDQLTKAELAGMSSAEIAKAVKDGRANALLSGDPVQIEQAEAIAQLREAQAMSDAATTGSADQGARNEQQHDDVWDADRLAKASPREVLAALNSGKLSNLLSGD